MRIRHQSDKAENILQIAVNTMQEGKGKDVISLNLSKIMSAVTDYFVICHGSSHTQVDAIAGKIVENVKKECGAIPYNKEGFENSEWILLDYVDVVIHVFLDKTRRFYHLEDLWADAEQVNYTEEED